MGILTRKPQIKAIYNNPLADKLKAKHAKAILEARIRKMANKRQKQQIDLLSKTA